MIVSRDSDYGITIENKSYINDHLRHEFSDRVSRKRKLLLFTSLSAALKVFDVAVSEKEAAVEEELLARPIYGSSFSPSTALDFFAYAGSIGSGADRLTDAQRAYLLTMSPNKAFSTGVLELLKHAGVESPKNESDEKKES